MEPKTKTNIQIEFAIQLAFEAGRWLGQVDLESHYDREQYSQAIIECEYSKKFAMPAHPVASFDTREVTITLRSERWRTGVRNSSNEYLQMATNILNKLIKNNKG